MCTIARSPNTIDKILLPLPDDFHHHFRDDPILTSVVASHASRRFGRCLAMPNLVPPVTTAAMALAYRDRIRASMPRDGDSMDLIMTLYLTDATSVDDIAACCPDGVSVAAGPIRAAKLYPAGATTNSSHGVSDVRSLYPVFRAMEAAGMVLCIHSEVPDADVDIFDREAAFIDRIMVPLVAEFTRLKIVMEHISTDVAVRWVENAPPNVAASITAHHLLYNRNALLAGGIRPHFYCLPILKRERHRAALLKAATGGNPRFFAGTDSAPHTTDRKESGCGCAGVFVAHAAVELYAEAFDKVGKLGEGGSNLRAFLCERGADFYGMERNEVRCRGEGVVLQRKAVRVPETLALEENCAVYNTVTPLRAGEDLQWELIRVTAAS